MTKTARSILIWASLVIAAIGMGLWLSGCAHPYEPPGQELWKML